MTSPVVNQCLVIGDQKPFVAALVTLDLADANNWLESQGAKPEPDLASLAKNAIVHTEVERAVNAANEGVSAPSRFASSRFCQTNSPRPTAC